MKAYPIELRKRVLAAVDAKVQSQRQIAEIFGVSLIWIQKLLHKRKTTGNIEPLPRTQGRKSVFSRPLLNELDELVKFNCSITLVEIQRHFAKKVKCSTVTIHSTLRRLGWGYKKNRYERLSRTEKMCNLNAGCGKKHNLL